MGERLLTLDLGNTRLKVCARESSARAADEPEPFARVELWGEPEHVAARLDEWIGASVTGDEDLAAALFSD